jgi:hypothetical protein
VSIIRSPEPASLFSIHGMSLRLRTGVPLLDAPLAELVGEFRTENVPDAANIPEGTIRPYDEAEVVRKLPASATRLSAPGDPIELYEKDERFWMIDDRWGMAEIDLVRAHWRSWVIPQPATDPIRTTELAVLWPLAQILRPRGLCLLPSAASLVRDDWGVLILAPFNVEPELSAMARAGYRVVGQRWTALREDDGRVAMLHLPGRVERAGVTTASGIVPRVTAVRAAAPVWVDLTRENLGASQNHAFCNAVMIVERGRRPVPFVRPVTRASALTALRRAWPITELHPHRRHGQLLAAVSRQCRVFETRLSRNPTDVLKLLDDARYERAASSVETTVVARTRRVVA